MNVFDKITVQAHAVAESSLLLATYGGRHIKDLKMDKDRDNGAIVKAGVVASTYKGIQAFDAKPIGTTTGVLPTYYLILTPPFGYNTDRKGQTDEKWFYNAKDEVARGYELGIGDIYTVSEDAFKPLAAATGCVVGNYVTYGEGVIGTGADAKDGYVEAAAKPATGLALQIIEIVDYKNGGFFGAGMNNPIAGATKSYRLQVVQL